MSEGTEPQWTSSPPENLGDYWYWDEDEDHRPVTVNVDLRMHGELWILDLCHPEGGMTVRDHPGGWWLPLPLPRPPEGKEANWGRLQRFTDPGLPDPAAVEPPLPGHMRELLARKDLRPETRALVEAALRAQSEPDAERRRRGMEEFARGLSGEGEEDGAEK